MNEWCAIFMLVSISLIYALVLFLSKYYLYCLEKAQYNPSLKLAIDISRVVKAPIEEIFIFD